MAWHIQDQTEKRGKAEFTVKCKHVHFFPMESGGQLDFGRLNFLCLRVIIKSDAGHELKLTLNTADGCHDHPRFNIAHPDTKGKPMIWIGQGKNRRKIKDELSPDVVIKGEKEKYDGRHDFEKRIKQLGGAELVDAVMDAFTRRFVSIMVKRSAKAAA